MRVLILWSNSKSKNLGVRVLAEGAEYWVRRAFPNESLEIVHQDYIGFGDQPNFGFKACVKDLLRINTAMRKYILSFDLVIDTGAGDSFSDLYGAKRMLNLIYVQRQAARYSTLVFSPQTIGPFKNSFLKRLAGRSLKKAHLVVARDLTSAETAASLGRPVDSITSDLVFTLPSPESPNTDNSSRSRLALLNISGLLTNTDRYVDSELYFGEMVNIYRGLVQRGYDVRLMPHVLANESMDNDQIAVERFQTHIENKFATSLPIVSVTDLNDARTAIAKADLAIGARMHFCLNALSTGVPAIAHAYSRKFAPLMEEIGWYGYVPLKTTDSVSERTLYLVDNLKHEAKNAMLEGRRSFEESITQLSEVGKKIG